MLNKKLLASTFFMTIFSLGIANNSYSSQELPTQKESNSSKFEYKISYLLGSGDILFINFRGLDLFSKNYIISPEGYLNLPEIGNLYVKGFTLRELKNVLIEEYKNIIINPEFDINITSYRPIQVYLGGEVKEPGLYEFKTLQDSVNINDESNFNQTKVIKLFEVLQKGNGITNYSDLSKIKVTRLNSQSQGGGKIRTEINLLEMILSGDQSQNIRIFDGDYIIVPRTNKLIKEQIISINRTNLTPNQIGVYINGNIASPGLLILKQGSSLVQAIYAAGGEKYFSGRIKHIRFNDNGEAEISKFNFNPNAIADSPKNPIIADGDIVYINRNTLGKVTSAIKEIGAPIIGAYSIFEIFD